jgi:hypothetical protein
LIGIGIRENPAEAVVGTHDGGIEQEHIQHGSTGRAFRRFEDPPAGRLLAYAFVG